MANTSLSKRRRKGGYYANVRWTFNTKVRATLVAWMRKLRARIWVIAPLVALGFGVDRDPVVLAAIVLIITLLSVLVQIVVESATDRGTDESAPPGACNSERKE